MPNGDLENLSNQELVQLIREGQLTPDDAATIIQSRGKAKRNPILDWLSQQFNPADPRGWQKIGPVTVSMPVLTKSLALLGLAGGGVGAVGTRAAALPGVGRAISAVSRIPGVARAAPAIGRAVTAPGLGPRAGRVAGAFALPLFASAATPQEGAAVATFAPPTIEERTAKAIEAMKTAVTEVTPEEEEEKEKEATSIEPIHDPITGELLGRLFTFPDGTYDFMPAGTSQAAIAKARAEEAEVAHQRALELLEKQQAAARQSAFAGAAAQLLAAQQEIFASPGSRLRYLAAQARGEAPSLEDMLGQLATLFGISTEDIPELPGQVTKQTTYEPSEALRRMFGLEGGPIDLGAPPSQLTQVPTYGELSQLTPEEREELDALTEVLFGQRLGAVERTARALAPPDVGRPAARVTAR